MNKYLYICCVLCLWGMTLQAQTPRRLDTLGSPFGNVMRGVSMTKYMRVPVLDTLSLNGRPDSIGAVAMLRSDKHLYKYVGGGLWQCSDCATGNSNGSGAGAAFIRILSPDGQSLSIPVFTGAEPVLSLSVVTPNRNGSGMIGWHSDGTTTYADYAHAPYNSVWYKIAIASGTSDPTPPSSGGGNTGGGTTDTTPVLRKPDLSAQAAGAHAIQLTWVNKDPLTTGYLLQYSTDRLNWNLMVSSDTPVVAYQMTGLTAFKKYYIREQGISNNPNVANSPFDLDSATTDEEPPPPNTALAVPAAFTATGIKTTKDSLHWSDVANETGFVIERSVDSATFTPLVTLAANTTTFIDSVGLSPSTIYYYRLYAQGDGTVHTNSAYTGDSARTRDIVFGSSSTKQGVLISTGNVLNNITALNNLNTGYFRSSYNGGTTVQYPSYTAAGDSVLLSYNDAAPVKGGRVTFGSATAFANKLDSLLTARGTSKLIGATIINEPNNIDSTDGYWDLTATQYIAILRAATTVLHAHGLKAAPGGLTGELLRYKVWEYYMDWGLTDSAADFAARAFPSGTNLNSWRASANRGYRIRFLDTLIDSLPSIATDYVNFHHYEQVLDADSLKTGINPLTFKQIAHYLACVTGKRLMSDEVGLNNNSNITNLPQLLAAGQEAGLGYMFWYGADTRYGVLVNTDATLTPLGTAWKNTVNPGF